MNWRGLALAAVVKSVASAGWGMAGGAGAGIMVADGVDALAYGMFCLARLYSKAFILRAVDGRQPGMVANHVSQVLPAHGRSALFILVSGVM